ncbi:Maf family protein [Atopobium minutum]|uniref:dTTP/UTP pyrophosphatase n=1 Tax=Atopobium minutum 10063974 TaxID=997872 RepID=N2BU97_9ACTN|nr:Maf family protein [Atopobium minutum]EMZ42045.1 septum formation protein Maf [Atopobium minutum 10063974]
MILASSSPRRLQLLQELGITPIVLPAAIDESPLPAEKPTALVVRLAKQKALACQKRALHELELASRANQVIVAADTTVWFQDTILGKPSNAENAIHMLKQLSGKTHQVSTGVQLLKLDASGTIAAQATFIETSQVSFYDLSTQDIERYVATGEPMDKAGAYGIQGYGRLLVQKIDGDFFSIVGLPVARLMREIQTLEEQVQETEGL